LKLTLMSLMRKLLKHPVTYLSILCVLLIAVMVDSCRSPEDQITGRLYVQGVHLYQAVARPLLKGRIQCRYSPSCSDYSIEAVSRFGIRKGLVLSIKRIKSCKKEVPIGTNDPVPKTE